MTGKILKGISGFYYVHVAESGIYECKAKGIFRQQKIRPLVGDDVEIAVIDEGEKTGNIEKILSRKNELFRPAVANIDMALVIFAAASPEPNLNLLDRFLVFMQARQVPVTICFNKMELVPEEKRRSLAGIYESCGYPVLFTSAVRTERGSGQSLETGEAGTGIAGLRQAIRGRTSAVAGPSGVGKSSLINLLQHSVRMETGEISRKISRGKQTTRHSQLIYVETDTYIMDTPGFSSLYLPEMEKEDLSRYYPEFALYEPSCRFQGCSHISEPDCGIKQALEEGKVHPVRYENYCQLYEELKERRKY